MIFKQGEPAETIQGANEQKLQRVVRELAIMATGLGSSSSSSGSNWRNGDLPKGYKDISDQVDVKGLELLNADPEFSGVRVLFEGSKPSGLDTKSRESGGDSKKDWVESDTDEQLMLFMPFQAILKVHTLQVGSYSLYSIDIPDLAVNRSPHFHALPLKAKTVRCLCGRKQSISTPIDHISWGLTRPRTYHLRKQ
jgi:hypothetical protein